MSANEKVAILITDHDQEEKTSETQNLPRKVNEEATATEDVIIIFNQRQGQSNTSETPISSQTRVTIKHTFSTIDAVESLLRQKTYMETTIYLDILVMLLGVLYFSRSSNNDGTYHYSLTVIWLLIFVYLVLVPVFLTTVCLINSIEVLHLMCQSCQIEKTTSIGIECTGYDYLSPILQMSCKVPTFAFFTVNLFYIDYWYNQQTTGDYILVIMAIDYLLKYSSFQTVTVVSNVLILVYFLVTRLFVTLRAKKAYMEKLDRTIYILKELTTSALLMLCIQLAIWYVTKIE